MVIDPVSMDKIDGTFVPVKLIASGDDAAASPGQEAPTSGPEMQHVEPIIIESRTHVAANGRQNGTSKARPPTPPMPPSPPLPPPVTLQEKLRARSRIREPIISRSFDGFEGWLLQQQEDDDDQGQCYKLSFVATDAPVSQMWRNFNVRFEALKFNVLFRSRCHVQILELCCGELKHFFD